MKKLLKRKICGSYKQCTEPIDVLKITEKSKFLTTIHAQYLNISLCLQLCVRKKKKKKTKTQKKENTDAKSVESKHTLNKCI